MSLASMTSDMRLARVLRCARCVFSGAIRTQVLRHLRASFDLGVVFGRDPDTRPFSGDKSPYYCLLAENCCPTTRFVSECRPTTAPVSESCPTNELRVEKSPDNGARIGKLLGSAARVRMSPDNAARVRMSTERGVSARSPSRSEPCVRIPLENPKAGETR